MAFDQWEETRRWTGGEPVWGCARLREMRGRENDMDQKPVAIRRCADSDWKGFFLGLKLEQSLIWKGSVIGVNV